MTGRRGYGCGGLFFQNEVSIPPLIQNDYLLLKKRIYETDKTGFLHGERGRNQNHDIYGVRPAYPAYGMRGKSGTVCRCEPADTGMLPAALCQEQWNGTPFYLLGGHGQEVRTINFAGRPKEEFETTCHDVLDSYDAVESIGAVVSRLRELSPEELHKRIAEEMKTGCKYLLVYRSEEEMTAALDGKIYAISDTDGKFLCDLYQPDYLHLENGGDIVDTASIPDMHFHSDWAIANPTVRDKVLSSRMVIIYTHETVTL